MNGELPLAGGELYWFGGLLQAAKAIRRASYRTGDDNRTVPDLYPNGFLPNIITTVEDGSLAVGYRRALNDAWDMDLSVNHGKSKFGFEERNSGQRQLVVRADRSAQSAAPASTALRRSKPIPARSSSRRPR
jgi:iron complex outermembrane receptor protein